MITLYHIWLSPGSRKLRLLLAEKKQPFQLRIEKVWERRREFLTLNPAGDVPVIIMPDGTALADAGATAEYLDAFFADPPLLPLEPLVRHEVRRLCNWFDLKFWREVSYVVLNERVMKRFMGMGQPNSEALRAATANIAYHLDYIGYLTERRGYLASNQMTLADITAAAHLSCMDYLDDVPWAKYPGAKLWYSKMKSRPSFRDLLADVIPGLTPPKHYGQIDF